jgi:hypothetical protein
VGFLDLPDEPGRPERASAGGADRPTPKRRALPDPDERGRTYEAMRAHASADGAAASAAASGWGLAGLPPACGNFSAAAEAPGGGVPVTWDLGRAAVSSGPGAGM